LEVELVGGKPRVLDAIDSKLRSAGARRSSSRSKLARALGDRLAKRAPKRQNRPSRNGGRPSRTGGRPSRNGAAEALARYLRAQRDAIHSTAPGVRSGDVDAVHDMRVATRRLRSTLRSFKPFIDPAFLPLIGELKWLADRLGAVRDGDVMGNRLSKAVAAVPAAMVIGPVAAMVAKRLADQRDGDRAALIEAMDSPRYVALLEAVDRLIESPPAKKVTPRRLRRQVRKALKRADRRLAAARNAGNAGNAKPAKKGKQRKATSNGRNRHGTSPSRDELLHASRRAYKRARYAVEVLADSDRKPAKRLVKRLTALQDVLGDHQDSIVIAKRLKDLSRQASDAGESAFTYGALHVLQKRAATRSLKGLRRARRRVAKRPIRRFLQK
jgi:CHAD domain-containing protein